MQVYYLLKIEILEKMKLELTTAIKQSLKYYIDKDIGGIELSRAISMNFEKADDLDKKQKVTFGYYIDFFEKEDKNLNLASNVYLKDEVDELTEFLDGLEEE